MAVSIAKKDNVYVGEIDVQLLRKQLKNQGAAINADFRESGVRSNSVLDL